MKQAEAAAAAGERSVRGFMVAVQRATSNVALVQQVIFYQTPILYPSFMMAIMNNQDMVLMLFILVATCCPVLRFQWIS
jgi:hypothetical protein